MDFITDLPPSSSFDTILVVVDQLTKMAHFALVKRQLRVNKRRNSFWIMSIATMDYLMGMAIVRAGSGDFLF
jgi:hypothetical protein